MRDELALMISWARTERRTALAELLEELQRARRKLAELEGSTYLVCGRWREYGLDGVELVADETGAQPPVDLDLDVTGLVAEVRRRQARDWVWTAGDGEGTPLEQLLTAVPPEAVRLEAVIRFTDEKAEAHWRDQEERGLSVALGPDIPTAIRAATLALLGLDAPGYEPLATGAEFVAGARAALGGGLELHDDMGFCPRCGSRDCACDEALATGDTEPPATQPSIGVGVEQEGNLIRAGGEEVDDD